MRPWSYAALALGLAVLGVAAYFSLLNAELLAQPVWITGELAVPLYLLFLLVFLAGFAPSAAIAVAMARGRDAAAQRHRSASDAHADLDERWARGVDLVVDGQWARAAEELAAVYERRGERLEVALFYGRALGRAGRSEDAAEALRRAIVRHPRSTALLAELAAVHQARGDAAAAEELRGRLVRDFPETALRELQRRRDRAAAAGDATEAARWQARLDAVAGPAETR